VQLVTTRLLARIDFFFGTLQAKAEALNLASELDKAFWEQPILAIYLERLADRCTSKHGS
jgi:hypothetical protein